MQNLFGIIDSQSRYELQQQMLLNPNGLVASTSNRYGVVDVSDNVERIRNVANDKSFITSISAFSTSREPLLEIDHFGTGLNAINNYDGVIQKELGVTGNLDVTKVDWDVEHYIAAKIKTRSIDANEQWLFSNGVSVLGRWGTHIKANSSGQTLYMRQRAADLNGTNPAAKEVRYVISVDTEYDLVCYFSGTNDSNDWRMWIDGVEVTPTVNSNQSFTGKTFYTTGSENQIRIGHEIASTNTSGRDWKGRYGKIILGYGLPNIKSIQAALNSPQ